MIQNGSCLMATKKILYILQEHYYHLQFIGCKGLFSLAYLLLELSPRRLLHCVTATMYTCINKNQLPQAYETSSLQ